MGLAFLFFSFLLLFVVFKRCLFIWTRINSDAANWRFAYSLPDKVMPHGTLAACAQEISQNPNKKIHLLETPQINLY
jgi:hypothetical protein